eukprot:403362661
MFDDSTFSNLYFGGSETISGTSYPILGAIYYGPKFRLKWMQRYTDSNSYQINQINAIYVKNKKMVIQISTPSLISIYAVVNATNGDMIRAITYDQYVLRPQQSITIDSSNNIYLIGRSISPNPVSEYNVLKFAPDLEQNIWVSKGVFNQHFNYTNKEIEISAIFKDDIEQDLYIGTSYQSSNSDQQIALAYINLNTRATSKLFFTRFNLYNNLVKSTVENFDTNRPKTNYIFASLVLERTTPTDVIMNAGLFMFNRTLKQYFSGSFSMDYTKSSGVAKIRCLGVYQENVNNIYHFVYTIEKTNGQRFLGRNYCIDISTLKTEMLSNFVNNVQDYHELQITGTYVTDLQTQVLSGVSYCNNVAGQLEIIASIGTLVQDNTQILCIKDDACDFYIATYSLSTCTDSYTMYFEVREEGNYDNKIMSTDRSPPAESLNLTLGNSDLVTHLQMDREYKLRVYAFVYVDGFKYTQNSDVMFTIIRRYCDTQVQFLTRLTILDQTYYISNSSDNLIFGFIPPAYSRMDCVDKKRPYSFTFSSADSKHLSFLSFDDAQMLFTVQTNDADLIGSEVKITIDVQVMTNNRQVQNNHYLKQEFKIKFKASPTKPPVIKIPNDAPRFVEQLVEQTIVCQLTAEYILPKVYDRENDAYSVKIIASTLAMNFIQYNQESKIIIFNPILGDEGTFEISVYVQQNDDINIYTPYKFNLIVQPYTDQLAFLYKKRIKKSKALPDLNARILKISATGQIAIKFDQTLDVEGDDSMLKKQLEKSLLLDTLIVIFSSNDALFSENLEQKLSQNYELQKKLQPQCTEEAQQTIQSIVESIKASMSSVFGSSMIVNIFLSQGMQQMWGMIEGFQLMTHLPMMSIVIPANTQNLFSLLNDIASFNLIPTEDLTNSLFHFDEESEKAYNDSFEFMGYENMNMIQNLGLLFYMIVINWMILILCLMLIFFLHQILAPDNKVLKYMKEKIVFNLILRFMIESSLEIGVCCFINVNELSLNASGDILGSSLSVILIFSIFLLPALAGLLTYYKQKDTLLSDSYSCFYDDLNLSKPKLVLFVLLINYRRVLYPMFMILLSNTPSMQLLFQINLSFMALSAIAYVDPYKSETHRNLVVMNEIIYLALIYSFIPQVEHFELSEQLRQSIGDIQIFICMMYLLINIALLLFKLFANLCQTIVNYIKKKRQKHELLQTKSTSSTTTLEFNQTLTLDLTMNHQNMEQNVKLQKQLTNFSNDQSKSFLNQVLDDFHDMSTQKPFKIRNTIKHSAKFESKSKNKYQEYFDNIQNETEQSQNQDNSQQQNYNMESNNQNNSGLKMQLKIQEILSTQIKLKTKLHK